MKNRFPFVCALLVLPGLLHAEYFEGGHESHGSPYGQESARPPADHYQRERSYIKHPESEGASESEPLKYLACVAPLDDRHNLGTSEAPALLLDEPKLNGFYLVSPAGLAFYRLPKDGEGHFPLLKVEEPGGGRTFYFSYDHGVVSKDPAPARGVPMSAGIGEGALGFGSGVALGGLDPNELLPGAEAIAPTRPLLDSDYVSLSAEPVDRATVLGKLEGHFHRAIARATDAEEVEARSPRSALGGEYRPTQAALEQTKGYLEGLGRYQGMLESCGQVGDPAIRKWVAREQKLSLSRKQSLESETARIKRDLDEAQSLEQALYNGPPAYRRLGEVLRRVLPTANGSLEMQELKQIAVSLPRDPSAKYRLRAYLFNRGRGIPGESWRELLEAVNGLP